MYAIDNDTASTTLPVPKPVGTPGFFTAGTIGGVPATIVEADWLNQVQAELLAVLAAASIAPSKTVSTQLIQAILWLIANNTRQRLTGPLNLYVNASTGSDTNNGLTPTTAFATPQAAWNYIMTRLDVGGQSIVVNMADGMYPPLICGGAPVGASASSSVIFSGDMVSPQSVVISAVNQAAVEIALGANVMLQGMRLQASGAGGGDYQPGGVGLISNSGFCYINNIDFGVCSGGHIICVGAGGVDSLGTPYSISGSAPWHAEAWFSGGNLTLADSNVTLYNTPTFSSAFVVAQYAGSMNVRNMVFNGAAHGPRYNANANGIIVCGVGNPNAYFPGDVNGSVSTGGIIV